jgi:hypothetical protein
MLFALDNQKAPPRCARAREKGRRMGGCVSSPQPERDMREAEKILVFFP